MTTADESPDATAETPAEYRIDDLAKTAGVATTTVRLYQTKGLLHGPRLVGRTGYYDDTHLTRLRLIHRLQSDGFSLAGIKRLLDSWETGRDLSQLVGLESELSAVVERREGLTFSLHDAMERLPEDAFDPVAMQRAVQLGLIELTTDGDVHIPDERSFEIGSALSELGVPVAEQMDQWATLVTHTDAIAEDFVGLFERYILGSSPGHAGTALIGGAATDSLDDAAAVLAALREVAPKAILVAFDGSLAKVTAGRLHALDGGTGVVSGPEELDTPRH